MAKQVNFAIPFGMGAESLARALGTDHEKAESYIQAWNERYTGVPTYLTDLWQRLRYIKPIRNSMRRVFSPISGRIRKFNEVTDRFGRLERKVRACQAQQMEADLAKMAMIEIDRQLRNHSMESRLVMMIHDSLVVEAPRAELPEARRIMKHAMEHCVDWPEVRLEVDIKEGWG